MVFDLNDQKNKVFHLNVCVCVCVCSVLSHCLHPHRLWPTRLLCPWSSLGKNTGVN